MNSNELVGRRTEEQLQLSLNITQDLEENELEQYQAGVTVQSFSSQGQMWRVFSRTTGRVHHYFSKLEYCTHVLLDLNPNVIDIKDQYSHDLVKSLEQSHKLGINHPPQNVKEKQPLTTDLVVEYSGVNGAPNYTVGIYVKYVKDFAKYRTVEKLQLERESLAQVGITLLIVSEEAIDKTIMKSVDWMLTVHTSQMEGELTFEYAEELYHLLQACEEEKLTLALNHLDHLKGSPMGYYLKEFKCLLQYGLLSFDLTKDVLYLESQDIELTQGMTSCLI